MIIIIIISILLGAFFSFSNSFVSPQEQVFQSLGEYEVVEYASVGYWQDFTDYGELTYDNPDFKTNEYYSQMTEEDIAELNLYLDNYEEWVSLITEDATEDMELEFAEAYDFDRNIISTGDYCYIYSNPDYSKFDSYDLYFYDTDSEILYYFHNNI